MSDLNLNRERLGLLGAIRDGKVSLSAGGVLLRQVRAGQKQRVERKVRELQEHGLVGEELVGGQPRLTDAGRTAVAG